MNQISGKVTGFKLIRQGESIIKLNDGNYLKVVLVVNKILRNDDAKTPDGFSVYAVQTASVISVWKPSEIAEIEDFKEDNSK